MAKITSLLKALALTAALFTCSAHAADTYSGTFQNAASTWNADSVAGNDELFYFTGASVSSTLSTNLGSVTHLDIAVPYLKLLLENITFTFSLNGTDIGTWTLSSGFMNSNATQNLSFDFSSISSSTGVYDLTMTVSTGVSANSGGVIFENTGTGTYTLTGTVLAVPEADTYLMTLAGLGLLGFVCHQRKKMQGSRALAV